MKSVFATHRFPLQEVLPDFEQAAGYLHLTDDQQPAVDFVRAQTEALKQSGLEAVGGYVCCPVRRVDVKEGAIETDEGWLQAGTQVCGYLKESTTAALFLCTAGQIFREAYERYQAQGDILEAYLTDALGSLAVENAMDRIHASLEAEMAAKGLRITNRYSPGYCNWPITDQKALFSIVGENPTGILLNDSCLMSPMKSVSGIIGIGADVRKRPYGCAVCQNRTCIYRRLVK